MKTKKNSRKSSTNPYIFGANLENESVNQHPWKLSRDESILNMLKSENFNNSADIGVNDMFYTKKLKSFTNYNVYGVDIVFPEESTIKDGIICLNDINKLPDDELDCLVMMDVLEHIEQDKDFLKIALEKVKENGTILITVPAWQFLFSIHDKRAQHFRRYNRKQLLTLLDFPNLNVEVCHYFYTSLFIARVIFLLKKNSFKGNEDSWNYGKNHILTKIIKNILNLDFKINKFLDKIGIHPPGLSLVALCKKR